MATEEYSIGYDAGYQDGWNAAMDENPKQEQGEPVAWIVHWNDDGADRKTLRFTKPDGIWSMQPDVKRRNEYIQPLYTTPQQRKPLTDEQITEIFERFYSHDHPAGYEFANVCRAIEAAHGIKE